MAARSEPSIDQAGRAPGTAEGSVDCTDVPESVDWADMPESLLRASCYLEVLIPALDEARRLPHALMRTIRYLEAQPYSSSVVVIDNGSVDRTVDLVSRVHSQRVAVHVIGCAQPGKGAAVQRGILTSRAASSGTWTPISRRRSRRSTSPCHSFKAAIRPSSARAG